MRRVLSDSIKGSLHRRVSVIICALLGTWIVNFPYEGQLLYALAKKNGFVNAGMLDISLIMLVVGLLTGGLVLRSIQAARVALLAAIPVCVLGTIAFFFPPGVLWAIALSLCAATAGFCITACGYFIKKDVALEHRFRTAAEILICISVLKVIINAISLSVSIQAGMAISLLLLAVSWYLTMSTLVIKPQKEIPKEHNKKAIAKAMLVLILFIMVVAIDFGIMIEVINPRYSGFGWLSSWYWLIPYAGAAFVMRRVRKSSDRSNILFVSVGMIGFGYLLFVMLDYSITSYLIVTTVMMGAWGIYDVFWWSALAEMFEMSKNPAMIFGVGYSSVMLGVLIGKTITTGSHAIPEFYLYVIQMAVICSTLVILPMLHRFLSALIKKTTEEIRQLPSKADALTEREREIVALMLKGRTARLMAEELYLSENTVKTHIKNIYSKLDIKSKAELFNYILD